MLKNVASFIGCDRLDFWWIGDQSNATNIEVYAVPIGKDSGDPAVIVQWHTYCIINTSINNKQVLKLHLGEFLHF